MSRVFPLERVKASVKLTDQFSSAVFCFTRQPVGSLMWRIFFNKMLLDKNSKLILFIHYNYCKVIYYSFYVFFLNFK